MNEWMNEWMNFLYTAHITKSHGGLQFYGVRSDVSMWRRLWQPLSVHIRSHPPTHPLNPSMSVKDRRPDHNTGNYVPYSCEQCVGSLTSHKESWTRVVRWVIACVMINYILIYQLKGSVHCQPMSHFRSCFVVLAQIHWSAMFYMWPWIPSRNIAPMFLCCFVLQ